MRNFLFTLIAAACMLSMVGCGNMSPRHQQEIDNQNGKIGEIETIQNGLKNEMLNLKSQSEIQNSRLDRIQQGIANFQTNNDNSGVQILSGPGGILVAIVGILAISVIAVHYRSQAKKQEKTANILAQSLVERNDAALEDHVFQMAMHTEVEEDVLQIMSKHQSILRNKVGH